MSVHNDLKEILSRLYSSDAVIREVAAAELGDLMEADYLKSKDFQMTVKQLIPAALREADWSAKERMFDALSFASSSKNAAKINWDPIAKVVAELDVACLEHALIILGDSGNPKYRCYIERFLHHPEVSIAETAADALTQIEWKQKQASNRRLKTSKHG
jgi:hypothetical protein